MASESDDVFFTASGALAARIYAAARHFRAHLTPARDREPARD